MKRYLLVSLVAVFLGSAVHAATFTVSNTTDSDPGSLRQAMLDANTALGPDIIAFNIPGAGLKTITPLTALPNITEAVTIDGYTQPGASANTLPVGNNAVLLIELNGEVSGAVILNVTDGAATIRGLVINRSASGAIALSGSGGSKIEGCFIGTDAGGTQNLSANLVQIGAPNTTIGGTAPAQRNLISGNRLWIVGGTGLLVQGNYIGTDRHGTAVIGGGGNAVEVLDGGGTIGGTSAGARNVISGNSGVGIHLQSTTPSMVQGNFIGTNATGTAGLGNGSNGITILSDNHLIGGPASGAGNLISGNTNDGVLISGGSSNTVQGNFIGTNVEGTAAIPNGRAGVVFNGSPGTNHDNLIGGTTAAERNVISGNSFYGVFVNTSGVDNSVQGNFIGTQANGISALGNILDGVQVTNGTNHDIGGTEAGAGNVIAYNGENGVLLAAGFGGPVSILGIAIQGNSIHDNGKLGINLYDADPDFGSVTPNDEGDADTGENNLQNFPVLTSVLTDAGSTTIGGTLNSVATTKYRIEFFANDAIDPSGNGEGQIFIGFTDVTTNANGDASFNAAVTEVAADQIVTATATDPAGNTSEFSKGPPVSRFLNISTRLRVQTGDKVLIGGFIVVGSEAKEVIVRAIGPSLGDFGVPDFLADPTLALHSSNGTVVSNNDWRETQEAEIIASGLAPNKDLESAIIATLDPGAYTAIVSGVNGGIGVGLVEAYDLGPTADSTLANISTRGFVETGDNVMIGGFIIGPEGLGDGPVLVRAVGPSLSGVPDALADPMLELRDGNGALIASNNDWKSTQQDEIEATGLAPSEDKEAAILATLPPGNYTAIVFGAGNTTGNGLVEAYNLQ